MTLKLNGSSSGYTAIDAPATAGSNTLVLPPNNGSANQVLKTDGSGNLTWVDQGSGIFSSYAILEDIKAVNNHGGSNDSSGGWEKRDLTDEIDPSSIVTLSSSQFTLQAGTYLIKWRSPSHNTKEFLSRLYNATDSTSVKVGSSGHSGEATSSTGGDGPDNVDSVGYARVTISGAKAFEIQMATDRTQATTGFGRGANAMGGGGESSIFTQVEIWKES